MQATGYASSRAGNAPAPSLLEKASYSLKLPLVVLFGMLLGISCAGYGASMVAWFGLTPLIVLVCGCKSRAEAMLTGLVFGLMYNLVSLAWMLGLYPLDWLGIPGLAGMLVAGQAWILESLHQAVLFAIFAIFLYTLPLRSGFLPYFQRPFFPMLISVPLIWVFLQWIIAPSPLFMGVPINAFAYSQAKVPAMIQAASFGGAHIIDFLIVMVNCALAGLILECTNWARKLPSRADPIEDKTGAIVDAAIAVALVSALYAWGQQRVLADAAMPAYWQAPKLEHPLNAAAKRELAKSLSNYEPAIPIGVVQPHLSVEQLKKIRPDELTRHYLDLMKDIAVPFVVLPANTLDQPARGTEPLRRLLPKMAMDQKKDIIAGVVGQTDDGLSDGAEIFSPDRTNKDSRYIKFRLLPLAQYTPLSFLEGLMPKALRQQISGGHSFVQAPHVMTLKSIFGRVGASVSAEIVYPDLIVHQVNAGASILVNVSDLSYFHNSFLGQELLAAAALRAVENGRYMVIASNGGVSAVIDAKGVVTSASVPTRKGLLLDRVQFFFRKTPYTRMCSWTPLFH